MKALARWLATGFVFAAMTASAQNAPAERIISIGSSVTEIVYELNQQDRLVGRDRTSSFPAQAAELPDIGYARALAPEGVLSVAPDMILSVEGAGPPEAIEVLKDANVEFVEIEDKFTRDGVVAKIRAVGAALGAEAAAEALAHRVGQEIDAAHAAALNANGADPARVLFILSAQDDRIMVGGKDTQADSIIRLAGGMNAADTFSGYKPITPEALATAAPDIILMMDRQGNHATDDDTLFSLPAIRLTPAGRDRNLVRMQGSYLLGFGPRTAGAITELSDALQRLGDS